MSNAAQCPAAAAVNECKTKATREKVYNWFCPVVDWCSVKTETQTEAREDQCYVCVCVGAAGRQAVVEQGHE